MHFVLLEDGHSNDGRIIFHMPRSESILTLLYKSLMYIILLCVLAIMTDKCISNISVSDLLFGEKDFIENEHMKKKM